MFRRPPLLVALTVAILVALPVTARAWTRPYYEDAQVVERSELIVIGHLKPNSITPVAQKLPEEAGMYAYHATLIITQSLKGKPVGPEIPIVIHHGLTPNPPPMPAGPAIAIIDTGDMDQTVVADALQDNIWCLRRLSGAAGRQPGTGDYGIVDPEDVQPLKFKGYFLAYLTPDPESALKTMLAAHPEITAGATRYLDHLAVQRILKLPDPAKRAEQLLPYFTYRFTWEMHEEAFDGLVATGPNLAGPLLLPLFADPAHHNLRASVIQLWGRTRYTGCVDALIALLDDNNKFWHSQQLELGWWSKNIDSPLAKERFDRELDIHHTLTALAQIGDSRAKPVIQATLKCWKAVPTEDPEVVDECTAALNALK